MVESQRVAEVYNRGSGGLGLLRQPSLQAIGIDKTAADLAAGVRRRRAKESIMVTKIGKTRIGATKTGSTKTGSTKIGSTKAGSTKIGSTKAGAKKIGVAKKRPPGRIAILKPARVPIKVARRMPATNVFGAVTLTHPERAVFPADRITKLDVAEYYRLVMPQLLAGIKGRPLSVIRCPGGISGECFFQKHLTSGLKQVSTVPLKEESGSTGDYVYVDDADGVFELVQFNALEFHPWGATVSDPDHAQYLVFDLDPAPEIAWPRVAAAAIDVRDLLARAGLKSFVRTTGGKGLHVVVPLRPAAEWSKAKKFAHALAESFASVRPREFLAVASKQRRDGRIFIDYLRNTRGATSVASYSLRARAGAPVAVPLRWAELKTLTGGDAFNIRNVPSRLKRMRADPWAGYDSLRQDLDSIAELPGI